MKRRKLLKSSFKDQLLIVPAGRKHNWKKLGAFCKKETQKMIKERKLGVCFQS